MSKNRQYHVMKNGGVILHNMRMGESYVVMPMDMADDYFDIHKISNEPQYIIDAVDSLLFNVEISRLGNMARKFIIENNLERQ